MDNFKYSGFEVNNAEKEAKLKELILEIKKFIDENKIENLLITGGTALKLSYGIIDRFSEDIDLLIPYEELDKVVYNPSKQACKRLNQKIYNYLKTMHEKKILSSCLLASKEEGESFYKKLKVIYQGYNFDIDISTKMVKHKDGIETVLLSDQLNQFPTTTIDYIFSNKVLGFVNFIYKGEDKGNNQELKRKYRHLYDLVLIWKKYNKDISKFLKDFHFYLSNEESDISLNQVINVLNSIIENSEYHRDNISKYLEAEIINDETWPSSNDIKEIVKSIIEVILDNINI